MVTKRVTLLLTVLILSVWSQPSVAVSVCGNGVLEGGEECDPGGPKYNNSPNGQTCVTNAQCTDGGTCVSGHCRCTSNAQCTNQCLTGPDGFGHCTCTTGSACFFANSGGCCKFNCQAVGSGLACDDLNACSVGEHCNQVGVCECSGGCNPTGGVGLVCRASAGECDAAEVCQPSTGCPADAKLPAGTSCSDDGNACTVDQCNGTSAVCQHTAGNAGVICRPSTGECDPAERCTGTSTGCPPEANPSGAPCSTDGNVCTDDICNGLGVCTHVNNTAPCSDDANPCTVDQCSGGACQHMAGNAGAICRTAAGACDIAETCTGTDTACPADAKRTTVCRASAGACDVAESCDGVNNDCPADAFVAATTTCRVAAGICDLAETCTGSSAACPADAKSTAVCRGAASGCDVAESCDGIHNACPADTFQPSTKLCDFGGNACQQGACNGAGACVFGLNRPAGTDCNDDLYCNGTDTCDGSGTCQHSGDPCGSCNTCQEDSHSCSYPAAQFAIISLPPTQLRAESVFAGLTSYVGGRICTDVLTRAGRNVQITGDVVATAATSAALTGPRRPPSFLVDGQCVTGGGSITGKYSCAGGEDRSGSSAMLAECQSARCQAGVQRSKFTALPVTPGCDLGPIKLTFRGVDSTFPPECVVTGDQVVIDTPEIHVGWGRRLTLVGDADTKVIVRVHGPLAVTLNATLAMQGVNPANVLFVVDGPVRVGRHAQLFGSVLGGSKPVRVALTGLAYGQLVGSGGVHISRGGTVQPTPFTGW